MLAHFFIFVNIFSQKYCLFLYYSLENYSPKERITRKTAVDIAF